MSQTYLAYISLPSPGSFSHGQDGRVNVLEEGDHERAGYHYREVISFHFKYKPYGAASVILFTLRYYPVHWQSSLTVLCLLQCAGFSEKLHQVP